MSAFACRGHPRLRILLVDKVIISQDSFGRFANDICPGAYQSMTHVNFKALDGMSLRPIGLYGPRPEIVRYIRDLNLVSRATYVHQFALLSPDSECACSAQVLLAGKDDMPSAKALRSGLYLLRDALQDVVYVIFWPQDTTWNDDTVSSVARNRATFMRYVVGVVQ